MDPSTLKVLLVDDDPMMLRILSKWLEKEVRSVCTATDGEQALRAIEVDCPDFILTDWEMPRMDGVALCQAVRALPLPHYVYIFFLTAKSSHEEIIAGLDAGANDFLAKPIHQGELIARLRAGASVLELERRLSQLARTDPLTGTATQRSFYEMLDKEWSRALRFHLPLSCVMIDLDFFKRINDVHGHPAGDAVLKSMAEQLIQSSRQSDTVCRYGGEEFCILLPETSEEEAAQWADRMRSRLAGSIVRAGGKDLRVTGSFGVAQRYQDTQTAEQLVDQADQALLTAKRAGRDRVVRFAELADASEGGLREVNSQEALFCGITARHVMSPLVACVRDDETVGQAAEFFLRSRINSTPVVDANGLLAGMLSEKDLMAAMVSLDCWEQPVREVMKPNVICYDEDTPIRVIYEFLCRVSIRRIVIAEDGRPTGTISRGTLLRWFRNLVINKGLLKVDGELQDNDGDPYRSKQRLADTARELAHQASRLEAIVQKDTDDLVPFIVGGATGMQELVTDLLAFSRYANCGRDGNGSLASLMLEGGNVD